MKWLKIITIILIFFIAGSITATVILAQTYSSNMGSIEGTGFIIRELNGAGGVRFDVDDDGNIYFAVTSPTEDGIVIYNDQGDYMYTLPTRASGSLGVKIDAGNNILAYDVRARTVTYYNEIGIKINTVQDVNYSLGNTFPWRGSENVRERNGIRYVNTNGTITKVEDGVETVVFTIPIWQRWYRAFKLIMILSIVALFLRIAIPQWIKALRKRKENNANE